MDLLVPDVPGVEPAANLALEEALVRAIPPVPLLRIWQNGPCVVLGRGQRLHREVNVAACAVAGVPVLRRASGGGTVYHDLGNLNITLAVPGWVPGVAGDLAALVAGVLRQLGLSPSATKGGVRAGRWIRGGAGCCRCAKWCGACAWRPPAAWCWRRRRGATAR